MEESNAHGLLLGLLVLIIIGLIALALSIYASLTSEGLSQNTLFGMGIFTFLFVCGVYILRWLRTQFKEPNYYTKKEEED